MKFTKEEAFEHLKNLLTENGKTHLFMSERSINEQLDTLMPLVASDEMELDDFVKKVTSTFNTMNLNAKNDQSVFVTDWKQKHPEPTPPAPSPKNDNEELLNRIKALEEKEANAAKAAAISEKKTALLNKIVEKGLSKEWGEAVLKEISLDENTDVDAKATSLQELYNKTHSSYTPKTPKTPSKNHEGEDEFGDVREARKQELGLTDGQ